MDPCDTTCKWKMGTLEPVLPMKVPGQLQHLNSVLVVRDGPYSLPRAAVKMGCWMTKPMLQNVARANGVQVPAGTGKMNKDGKRTVLKSDVAWALVNKWWRHLPADEKKECVRRLCFGASHTVTAPLDIVSAVRMLDHNNAETFAGLSSLAEKALDESEKARARGLVPAPPCHCSAHDQQHKSLPFALR